MRLFSWEISVDSIFSSTTSGYFLLAHSSGRGASEGNWLALCSPLCLYVFMGRIFCAQLLAARLFAPVPFSTFLMRWGVLEDRFHYSAILVFPKTSFAYKYGDGSVSYVRLVVCDACGTLYMPRMTSLLPIRRSSLTTHDLVVSRLLFVARGVVAVKLRTNGTAGCERALGGCSELLRIDGRYFWLRSLVIEPTKGKQL